MDILHLAAPCRNVPVTFTLERMTTRRRLERHREGWRGVRGLLANLLAIAGLMANAGCTKTVAWEEEVALNSGEMVTVDRRVVYSLQGGHGNPFDVQYRPRWNQTLDFTLRGKHYRFAGDALLMLLAVDPNGSPILVARAGDNEWIWTHRYPCKNPFYVQFVPTGRTDWQWQTVEAWLYGLPANLMLEAPALAENKKRYTTADRDKRDGAARRQSPSHARVDPNYAVNCNMYGG